jgi:hypothetical protein
LPKGHAIKGSKHALEKVGNDYALTADVLKTARKKKELQ